ncbi:MAG: hypothetical protein QW270_00760 [Candidatus Bathyarchaeia archaeon]
MPKPLSLTAKTQITNHKIYFLHFRIFVELLSLTLSPSVRGFYAIPHPYTRRFAYARIELKNVDKPLKVMDELFRLVHSCKSKSE